jgi:ion channel-forming bestrophin family protein
MLLSIRVVLALHLISHVTSLSSLALHIEHQPRCGITDRPKRALALLTPLCRSRSSRSGIIHSRFSPAYDTTVRYAAIDWARNMRTLPRSMVLQRIASPLRFVLATTFIVLLLNHFIALPRVSSLAHTLLGSALGLLLVFRTNAAYDRFWESRKSWSIVTSECRQLATLACTFMTPEQALPMLSLIAAFPVCLKNYLRGGSEGAQKRDVRRLRSLLLPEEAACLFSVDNQPLYVLARLRALGQASAVTGVTEKEREVMFKSASTLGECVATCERIFNTPIPLAYSRHTSRFLVLYVSTLCERCRFECCGFERCGCERCGCERCGCERCRFECCGCEHCRCERCGFENCGFDGADVLLPIPVGLTP